MFPVSYLVIQRGMIFTITPQKTLPFLAGECVAGAPWIFFMPRILKGGSLLRPEKGKEEIMKKLSGFQAKYLRGLAHGLKPVVFIGHKGMTDALVSSTEEALDKHELIKVKFIEYKEKKQKKELSATIEKKTDSQLVGIIGHMAIFYRQQRDPDKRKIYLPDKKP